MNNGYAGCMSGNMMDTTCSAVVNATSVNCSAQSIADLSGIEYFDNLNILNCSNNPITSLRDIVLECSISQAASEGYCLSDATHKNQTAEACY